MRLFWPICCLCRALNDIWLAQTHLSVKHMSHGFPLKTISITDDYQMQKIWNYQRRRRRGREVGPQNFFVLKSSNFEILKFWNHQIFKLSNFEIIKFWNHQFLRSSNLEIIKFWNNQILKSSNFEIINIEFWPNYAYKIFD